MGKILGIQAVSRPRRGRKLADLSGNLVSYAFSAVLLSAVLTGVLAVSVLLSVARLW